MDCYDHVTDKWTSLSAPRQNRHSHCSMSLNGYLYVIGGKFMAFLLKKPISFIAGNQRSP